MKKTLENINFEIKKNDFIAIVGKTGTGKTTFLNLFMGLLKPSSGKIEIDGINIHNNIEAWRANLGYVPQNINLLDESLKKYSLWNERNSISNIDVKSIELSQLSEFLENDDRKLDLRVGESGIKISGGQKQRIGVARALFHDPEILIFDEPTSSLDPITTNNLLDTFFKKIK